MLVLGVVLIVGIVIGFRERARVWGGAIGVLRIQGPIHDSIPFLKALRDLRKTPYIKAILVRIDSPGGRVAASEEIYRELLRARKEHNKPVVVSMANVAASGGYYISLAADRIVANHGTITGSIGVIATELNVYQLLKTVGIESVTIKSGEHKDTGSPFRAMTTEERNLLQGIIYDTYRQFVREVLRQRKEQIAKALASRPGAVVDILSTATTKRFEHALEQFAFTTGTLAAEVGTTTDVEVLVRTIADGRVFSGEQAWTLGLVDELGTYEHALRLVAEIAKLPPDAPIVDRSPKANVLEWLGNIAGAVLHRIAFSDRRVEYLYGGR